MKFKDRLIVGILAVVVFIGFNFYQNNSRNLLTNDDVDSIISSVEQSFIDAEKEILQESPPPPDIPDNNVPTGPDPDPEKCICKGTGKIVQGDGHVSACPYHGDTQELKDEPQEPKQQEGIINSTKATTTRRSLFPRILRSRGS